MAEVSSVKDEFRQQNEHYSSTEDPSTESSANQKKLIWLVVEKHAHALTRHENRERMSKMSVPFVEMLVERVKGLRL